MPPGMRPFEYDRVPPPKGIGDVPRYLRQLLGGFFSRFWYIVKLVWETGRWILIALTLIALFNGVTPVVGSLISTAILNELQDVVAGGFAQNDFLSSPVIFLIVFFFVYKILKQVISSMDTAVTRIAGEKVVRQVKLRIMEKSKTVDLASFDLPEFYEKMENANREAGNRPLTILSQTFGIVSTVIELVSYLIILFTAPGLWWLPLILFAISLPSAIINFIYRKKNFRYMRNRSKERRQMNYYAETLVNKDMVKEVRMFDLADGFIRRYKRVFGDYYSGLRRLILSETLWHVGLGILAALVNLLFYVLVARLVFIGEIRIGDYTLYTGAIGTVAGCVSTLISRSSHIYEGTLFIDNLIAFMKQEPTVVPHVQPPRQVTRGKGHCIQFVNVSFRYPGTEREVIKNVNLTIRPGETVVLVGLNGAGKTTLIKLLTRLYDPTEGQILLDGKDLREYDVQELYRIFGIIFQDFGKYALTVEENIRLGDVHKEADHSVVVEAAKQSAVAEYIDRLPAGYDTPLMRIFEKDGIELSIGQWQKLAIARAFYADSDILILDEPTASLDPMAEQEIFRQFDLLRENKTTIFVSHRLSSATVANQIVVLEDGKVAENGSHSELMALRGKYYTLFSTQAKRYVEEEKQL